MILRFSHVSIRLLLSLLFGAIAALALIFVFEDLSESLEAAANARLIAQRNEFAVLCMQGVKSFALERGRSNVVLHASQPISAQDRLLIDQRRRDTDAAIASLLMTAPRESAEQALLVRQRWDAVKRLRKTADEEFARPLQSRNPDFAEQWLVEATALVHQLEKFLGSASRLPNESSTFDRVSKVRLSTLRFRGLIGTESMRIAARLSAGNALKKEEILEIYKLRGSTDQLWEEIEESLEVLDDAGFSKAVSALQHEYFGRLRPLQDRIIQQASPQPTLEEYSALAIPTLDLAVDVMRKADGIVQIYAEDNLHRAQRKMWLSVVSILLVIMVAGLAFWVLVRRFTQPLRRIANQIKALQGQSALSPQTTHRDEFVAIQQALDLLAESMQALNETKRQLEILAVTDPLTGAGNRRHLFSLLESEQQRIFRGEKCMSILLMDIDHFKHINDTCGHAVGDGVLKSFVHLCENSMRPTDSLCRYGGEEFVLLLPMTEPEEALAAAERLRASVAATAFTKDETVVNISVSIGIASYRTGETTDELLQRADSALYEAKRAGRNRVAV